MHVRTESFDDVTVGGIARAADVGRTTFYEHFAGKGELLDAVVRELLASFAESSGFRVFDFVAKYEDESTRYFLEHGLTAAQEAARFAINTWADVTLVGLEDGKPGRQLRGTRAIPRRAQLPRRRRSAGSRRAASSGHRGRPSLRGTA